MSYHAIVLCGDNAYIEKISTTMKSICMYNKGIHFYIFNDDIPQEWFLIMNRRLKVIDCKVTDIKINAASVSHFVLPSSHINYRTYYRYFIGEFVQEERAIYLDSDMIVTDSLQPLFEVSLDHYMIGAVPDLPKEESTFNAGLLVIDVTKWRKERCLESLLQLTNDIGATVYGDQGVLNEYFKERWLKLPVKYNLQVGADNYLNLIGSSDWFEKSKEFPVVIHYTLKEKPWKEVRMNRYRDIWWKYYMLEWSDILLKKPMAYLHWNQLVNLPNVNTAIFTNTANVEQLEYLATSFPQVQFHVGAHTFFGEDIWKLRSYTNIAFYPAIEMIKAEEIIQKIDFYLDINYENEILNIIEICKEKQITIFSFYQTSHDESDYSRKYDLAEKETLVKDIQNFIEQIKGEQL